MPNSNYQPQEVEHYWQSYWDQHQIFRAEDDSEKPKKFVLVEFPYPSGSGLHMGHLRPYVAGDVYSRYWRLRGYEVIYPMGWDAFGLPAENYAIKNNVHPAVSTAQNIANAKRQLKSWGLGFDWSREINTTDPEYYRWTQWIFLQLYKAGLAYESTGLINWCPIDKTGLANEEVIDGACERCGSIVEKRNLRQWYLKITAYAEKLLNGLDQLPSWPVSVKTQQANWIGKSVGATIDFKIQGSEFIASVFTTRPDTIFGATYIVLAPEHELLTELSNKIENWPEVQSYIEASALKQEMERTTESKDKTGVVLKGLHAINPATNMPIPIWVADYVLGGYGTGAIMAVPAHDERDYDFASQFKLANFPVIVPEPALIWGVGAILQAPDGSYLLQKLDFNTHKHPGQITPFGGAAENGEGIMETLSRELMEELEFDLSSAPVPEFLGWYPSGIDDQQLALFLVSCADPEKLVLHEGEAIARLTAEQILNHELTTEFTKEVIKSRLNGNNMAYKGDGILVGSGQFTTQVASNSASAMADLYGHKSVKYKLRDWVFSRQRYWGEPIPLIHCADCGVVPVPEQELPVTLPEVEQYEPTGTGESPLAAIDDWVNTVCPKCSGPARRETNTMPQWAGSSWYYMRYLDPSNRSEFAAMKKLSEWLPINVYFGGLEHTTLHLLYSRFWHLALFDLGYVQVSEPYTNRVPHGIVLASDGEKMSKSRGNVVNPDDIVEKYGADTLRMYELFLGPHEATVSWNDRGVIGVRRFLESTWQWVNSYISDGVWSGNIKTSPEDEKRLHKLIKKISNDIESFRFNTCISSFMQFKNEVKQLGQQDMIKFLTLLYPFAPHIVEELNKRMGNSGSVQDLAWPEYNPDFLVDEEIEIIIQVNGKIKERLKTPSGMSKSDLEKLALQSSVISSILQGQKPRQIVVVPGRLVNIVL